MIFYFKFQKKCYIRLIVSFYYCFPGHQHSRTMWIKCKFCLEGVILKLFQKEVGESCLRSVWLPVPAHCRHLSNRPSSLFGITKHLSSVSLFHGPPMTKKFPMNIRFSTMGCCVSHAVSHRMREWQFQCSCQICC